MELKIFFSPTEIRQFFEKNGFQVIEKEFEGWNSAYHNSSKCSTWMEDVVLYGGSEVKASELFRFIAETNLKMIIAPRNGDMKESIEMHLKQLLKLN